MSQPDALLSPHTCVSVRAYEALQLFSSQAKRKAKEEPAAGVGVALEGETKTPPPVGSPLYSIRLSQNTTLTRHAGATALIEQGYPECGLELGAVILDVAQEADKEAGKGNGQPIPGDLVRARAHMEGFGMWSDG